MASLVFLIVIAVVYFKKKRYNSTENNIYMFLILWTIALLVLEISCDVMISYRAQFPMITEALCRIYIFCDAGWFILLIAYMEAFLSPEKYESVWKVFSKRYMIFFVIISSVMFFISCFLELTYTSPTGEFNVIGGKALFVLYAVFLVMCILMIRFFSRTTSKVTFIKRLPLLLYFLLFTIMKAFQYFYTDVNDLGFLFAFAIVAMYFTIENQDTKLVSELDTAREKAESADKDKTEFLSKMSHDIRTPMNVIMGFSENLLEKETLSKKETMEDVEDIYSAGRNLLEIINNILLFSKIESGKESVEEVEYDILDLINELHSFVDLKIKNSDVDFKINVNGTIPRMYYGDKQKLISILENLLSNAVNFTLEGSIEVNFNCFMKTNDIGLLKIEVKDTGVGMKEDQVELLLSEFSNTDNSSLDTTNLGLLVVKKLVNMLDAKISFDSKYGFGTVFTLEIKQKVLSDEKIDKSNKVIDSNLENDYEYFDLSNKKILIVDDNELNTKVAKKLFKHYNANLKLLNSGQACIDSLKNGGKYDLILLDYMMPEMDGVETIKRIKQISSKEIPPIVMLTASVSTKLKEQFISEGFDDCLEKPINPNSLNKLLIKYFKSKDRGE